MPLDANPDLPRFQQIRLILRDRIRGGYYETGMPLPGERQLAQEFGVARVTVRSALARLEEEGMVARLRGKGTVPTFRHASTAATAVRGGLLDNIVSVSKRTRVTVLEWKRMPAPPAVSTALDLPPGAAVLKVVRVRKFKAQPIAYTEVFVPDDLAGALDRHTLQDTPMLVALEQHGVHVVSADQTLGAAVADLQVARILRLSPGVPLLRVSRIATDRQGRRVQYLVGLYHPERYTYQMRLSRVGGATRVWIDADSSEGDAAGSTTISPLE
ncbi:GntR family transcriptional regulator [Cupriavidus pinatubonensis]|uniref:HTH-type transcriptional repressor NagR n=1 Tax=Cupriavidus pinatubonensis TaxID=248026 RepID=A0ABM8WBM7_9BURK|nr:GntR family transcriptional regulator [Cupriavidus pinatubonensis]CAG9164667.1 HTH-type transcriptional repressor NagR [Cupriavidus pinatubonensis]